MTTKKSTSLSGSLLVRRKPAPAGSAPAPAATQPDGQQPAKASATRPRATYAKALTLKLDQGRYQALKLEGIKRGRSSQQILLEALDGWLERAATSPSK